MLNAISSYEYDPEGHVVLDVVENAAGREISRRVQRSATLDGGAALSDGGFSDADRTISIEWANRSEADSDAVSRLLQLYSRLVVSVRDGVFLAAPERLDIRDSCNLRLLVLEKLST